MFTDPMTIVSLPLGCIVLAAFFVWKDQQPNFIIEYKVNVDGEGRYYPALVHFVGGIFKTVDTKPFNSKGVYLPHSYDSREKAQEAIDLFVKKQYSTWFLDKGEN